ncbi:MAG: hypothetical protein LBE16_06195, partial [Clostridiales Family XIII bacterium]|nr:hypothetical protein [Clostridiales Family XIII bacterium]
RTRRRPCAGAARPRFNRAGKARFSPHRQTENPPNDPPIASADFFAQSAGRKSRTHDKKVPETQQNLTGHT